MKTVLHIITQNVVESQHVFLGSTKDIRSRSAYFKARGIRIDELIAPQRHDPNLLNIIKKMDLSKYNAVLIEYPLYPRSIKYIKKNYPSVIIMVRSHNAEFIHNIHRIHARGFSPVNLKKNLIALYSGIRRLWFEFYSAKYADYIFSITAWEKEHYWRYFTDPKKIRIVPYYLADEYIPSVPDHLPKKKQCICLLSTITNPFLEDAAHRFIKNVKLLGNNCPDWQFYITGDISGVNLPADSRVIPTGMLKEPFQIMLQSSAVALLSDYGYGFKTKLLDAVLCRCHLLVTRGLYERLPAEIQRYSHIVDGKSAQSFEDALRKSEFLLEPDDVNNRFKEQAWTALDECLLNVRT